MSAPPALRHGRTLPNRSVLASITDHQSHPDGTMSDVDHAWLVARTRGGFGLTPTAFVSEAGKVWPHQLSISSDVHLPGLERFARAVAEAGIGETTTHGI